MDSFSKQKQSATLGFSLAGRLIDFDTIMQQPLPPIEWVVEPLIPHPSRTVVFGEFGSLKSWLLLDLGLHIAAGSQWLNTFTVPQARSVLYMDEEMSELELRRRVKRLGNGAGLKGQVLPFRAVSQLGLKFTQPKVQYLLKELQQQGFDPDVVIVETLRRVLDGSENEAEDVSEFWRSVSPIVAAGKTLIVSHHMRKPNTQGQNEVRHRASGSTDILAGVDCAFAITRTIGDVMQVECVKSRTAKEAQPFFFSLHDIPGQEATALRIEGTQGTTHSIQSEEARASDLIKEVFATAPDHRVKTKEVLERLKTSGISTRTGERAFRHFKGIWAEQVKRGEYRLCSIESKAA